MGSILRFGVGAAVLVSSLVGNPAFDGTPLGASAAEAGGGYYNRHYRRHHYDNDDFDWGDAFVGAVVVGGLVALMSSASAKQKQQQAAPPPPPPAPLESGWEPKGDWNNDSDLEWADRDWANRTNEERTAITVCAREADDLGSRYQREARVSEIGDVDREGGEYRVHGAIETRGGEAGHAVQGEQAFTCYVRNDSVTDFRFDAGLAAR